MRTGKKVTLLLVLTAAVAVGGCAGKQEGQITIGDKAVMQTLLKHVQITSDFSAWHEIYPSRPLGIPVRRMFGGYDAGPKFPQQEKIMGLSGQWLHLNCLSNGFNWTDQDGKILYESGDVGVTSDYRAYPLSTSDPTLRLWVIKGPSLRPEALWVLGERAEGITCFVSPDDLAKTGIRIEQPGKEKIDVQMVDGALEIAKAHMGELVLRKMEKGKVLQNAQAPWEVDKKVTIGWDDNSQSFKIGAKAAKKETGMLESLLRSFGGDYISDLKIESIEKWKSISGALPQWKENPKGSRYAVETSNGKKIVFDAFRDFFRITSENGDIVYYTSEVPHVPGERFLISELKVSDPDTRLWSVTFDSNSNTGTQNGFWLVGEHKGVLKVYITDVDMAAAGLPLPDTSNGLKKKGGHRLYLKPVDGKIQGFYTYEFWPMHMAHAQAKRLLDKSFWISWDNKEQTFKIMNVKEEAPAYVNRGADPFKEGWTVMDEKEAKTVMPSNFTRKYH